MDLSTVFHSINSPYNSVFSLCSFTIICVLLVVSTTYIFMKVSFSPDVIRSGWLGSNHQLSNWLPLSRTYQKSHGSHTVFICKSQRPGIKGLQSLRLTNARTSHIFSITRTNPTHIYISHPPPPPLHQFLNRAGRWGTTDDFATSFLHLSPFSTALWDLPNSRLCHAFHECYANTEVIHGNSLY